MKLIDLTYTLSDKMLVYPGNTRPVFSWLKRANADFLNATHIEVYAHTGTHVDSPLHFLPDGETIDNMPPDFFLGKARLYRFKTPPNKQEVGLKEVLDSGFSLGEAKIFILDTGISTLADTYDFNYLYPVAGLDLVEWLIKAGVKNFMTDSPSLDYPGDMECPRHKTLFKHGRAAVENLTNLDQLPENKDFYISALPLKLEGREGSPCRAVAWLDD